MEWSWNTLCALLSIVWLQTTAVVSLKCGPHQLCSCSYTSYSARTLTVDCSNIPVNLEQVCDYIALLNTSALVELDVSRCNVTKLNTSIVQGCKYLSSFIASENNIIDIPNDTFEEFHQLEKLDLSSNKMSSIYYSQKRLFWGNLPQLQRLRLNGNFIVEKSGRNFSYPDLSSYASLQLLSMDGLRNVDFDPSYRSLEDMHTLYLNGSMGHCSLGQLENKTFTNLPQVKALDISMCNITDIDAGTFVPMKSLTWLDMSLNRRLGFRILRNVSYGLQFTQIDFLNASHIYNTFGSGTRIMKRDLCFMINTTLRELSVNSNRIELFDTNLPLMMPSTFQILHVEDNRFTFGPYLLQAGCLTNITVAFADRQNTMHPPTEYIKERFNPTDNFIPLDNDCPFTSSQYLKNQSKFIKGCLYIDSIPASLTGASLPPHMKTMKFADSNMKYRVPRLPVVPFMNSIENLDFSGNILYALEGPVGPLPAIKFLNLSSNYCSHIGEQFFFYASSLEVLDIAKNFLGTQLASEHAFEIFKPLENLRYLYLSTNQIKSLPRNIFQYLVNLEYLDLRSNIIDTITFSFINMRNLSALDVSKNALQYLPDEVISHFEHFTVETSEMFFVNLNHNPIKCSCIDRVFLQWMLKNKNHFRHFENYTFVNDDGNPVTVTDCMTKVAQFDKVCPSYSALIVVCSISITFFLSLVIGGVIYKNRWKLRYLLYMNKKRFYGYQRIPNEDPIENYRYDAFISYSNDNLAFILHEMIPNLEARGLRLCIHDREFLPGNAIADNIINAIQSSRRTVVILSKTFLKRKWCRYEFQMARMESIYSREGGSCLIVVKLEEVQGNDMPLEMIDWIQKNSYIEFTQNEEGYQLFWQNLTGAIARDDI